MKIDNPNNVNRVNRPRAGETSSVDRDGSKSVQGKSSEGQSSDTTSISKEAQLLAKALTEVKETSDVREDRVQAARDQILSGQYKINYDELAKRLYDILGGE